MKTKEVYYRDIDDNIIINNSSRRRFSSAV